MRAQRALRIADRIVTISRFTQQALLREHGISQDRISVLTPAPDPQFRPVTDEKRLAEARAHYRLPERFVLTLGSTDPRKNVATVVAAHRLLPSVGLVIVGPPWHGRNAGIWEDAAHEVRVLGYVEDHDLPAIYTLSEVFVFPSLHEGFGMTPLEAMSCGTPVVCSNASSLPEAVGDAAILVDAVNVEALAAATEGLLGDAGARERLRQLGLAHVRGYSWERSAAGLLELLERAAAA